MSVIPWLPGETVGSLSHTMVSDQVDQAKAYASSAYNAAVDYLDGLTGIIGDLTLPSVDIETANIEIPSIDIEIPPDLDDIICELDIPAIPTLEAFDESEVTPVLSVFQISILNTLETGGTGIDEDTENAVYSRARDREAQSFEDEQEKVEGMFSSRGFSSPPGAMSSLMARLSIEKLRKDENINNEIFINQTKLAQGQTQFAMSGVMELFKARIDLFGKNVAAYGSRIEGYKAKVLVSVQAIEVKVKAFDAKVRKYMAEVDMNKAYYETLATRIKMQIDKARLETDIALKQMEATITGYLAMQQMQLSATEAGANTMAQLAASALSAISTATGFNFHGSSSESFAQSISDQYSRSSSDSESYSEIHSYDETGI